MAVVLMGAPLLSQVFCTAPAAPRGPAKTRMNPLGLLSMQHSPCIAVDAHIDYWGHSMWSEAWLWEEVKGQMLSATPDRSVQGELLCTAILQAELGLSRLGMHGLNFATATQSLHPFRGQGWRNRKGHT